MEQEANHNVQIGSRQFFSQSGYVMHEAGCAIMCTNGQLALVVLSSSAPRCCAIWTDVWQSISTPTSGIQACNINRQIIDLVDQPQVLEASNPVARVISCLRCWIAQSIIGNLLEVENQVRCRIQGTCVWVVKSFWVLILFLFVCSFSFSFLHCYLLCSIRRSKGLWKNNLLHLNIWICLELYKRWADDAGFMSHVPLMGCTAVGDYVSFDWVDLISGYDVALCLSSNVCLCAGIACCVRSSMSVFHACYVVIFRYVLSWLVSCSHCQILIVSFVFGSDPG